MFHLFSLVVFFHPSFHFPLTAARPRKHRTLNFIEDDVTLIAVITCNANYLAIITEFSV